MSTGHEHPDFGDPSAVHPLLPARTRWPERELPVPPPLPPCMSPDHRVAHVAITMGALLLSVSAWTNAALILSAIDASLPPRFGERGEALFDHAQDAETIRLFTLSMSAHGITLVFLVLASISGGNGHRSASAFLLLPIVFGVLMALAGVGDAWDHAGR